MAGFNDYYKTHRKKKPLRWPDVDVVRLISKAQIAPNAAVLDLGCGEGRNLRFLLDCGYLPLCVDASEEGLRLVKELYSLPDNRLIQSDAIAALEGMEPSSFDLVLCWGLSHYVEDTNDLLKNLRRVLKNDGSLVMSFSARDDQRPRADEIKILFEKDDVIALFNRNNIEVQDFGKTTMIDYNNTLTASYFWVRATVT
jgi:SAM-dependent methyltransferase